MFDKSFNSEKSIINLVNIDRKINMVVENYEPKTKVEYDNETRVISVLNKVRGSIIDFYSHPNTVKLNTVPSKYSKHKKSVAEIKD